jgi:hypothetical protein
MAETAHQHAPISTETAHGDARNGAPRRAKQRTSVRPNNKNIEENIEEGALRANGASKNGADKSYVFEGRVIRLLPAQFKNWQEAYREIPDLTATLRCADDYYAEHPPKDGKWFFPVSRWLEKENSKAAEKRQAAERERHSW